MKKRLILLVLWVICALTMPLILLLMLGHTLFGSITRAQHTANAIDEAANCLFGGDERETISRRTGLAVIAGKPWGLKLAPVIDAFFGKGHCREKALQILK